MLSLPVQYPLGPKWSGGWKPRLEILYSHSVHGFFFKVASESRCVDSASDVTRQTKQRAGPLRVDWQSIGSKLKWQPVLARRDS